MNRRGGVRWTVPTGAKAGWGSAAGQTADTGTLQERMRGNTDDLCARLVR